MVPRVQLSTQDVLDNIVHNEEENDEGILISEVYNEKQWLCSRGVFGPPTQICQVTYPFLGKVTYHMRWILGNISYEVKVKI